MTEDRKPIALDAYEKLADHYAAHIDTKFENAYIERPATLSLIPDAKGKRVLDVGCGPGVYSEWLIGNGAEVVAIDVSPKMVELARERLPESAEVRLADLGKPLDFLEDVSFDMVLAPLVLDCIEDWDSLFGEFNRILRDRGHLILSICHPLTEFLLRSKGSYFDHELVEAEWTGFGLSVVMPSYRRPLSALVTSLIGAGFILEKMLEPTPIEESRKLDPRSYEKFSRKPTFLCLRARKNPG